MKFDLEHTRVLILGGSSGIGLATAAMACDQGAEVTVVGRSELRLQAARRQVPAIAQAASIDLTDAGEIERFFRETPIWDHVVVTSADTRSASIRELPLQDAYESMRSKFWGAYHAARASRIAVGGSLTFVSGEFSARPSKNAVLQGAINAALEGLMRGLALEFSPVRVNAVSPTVTDTPLWEHLDPAARQQKFQEFSRRVPLGRIARAAEVAAAIFSVACNPYITGSTLLVDGGDALV